jgi:hypothetical protein
LPAASVARTSSPYAPSGTPAVFTLSVPLVVAGHARRPMYSQSPVWWITCRERSRASLAVATTTPSSSTSTRSTPDSASAAL